MVAAAAGAAAQRRIDFPPTCLLFEIAPKEETSSRTPWWLTLLRLTLAALVIIAAAGPLWNPPLATSNRAALLLILLDDGWSAANSWDARLRTADELIARAEADERGVALLPLSEIARDISLQIAGAARVQVKQSMQPHAVDRRALPVSALPAHPGRTGLPVGRRRLGNGGLVAATSSAYRCIVQRHRHSCSRRDDTPPAR